MALQDFWSNVWRGAGLIAPRSTVDSPKLDANSIERILRGATLWLTPRAVAGFEESDFEFLPDVDRERLAELVKEFRAVSSTVNPTAPAPKGTVEEALPLFQEVVQRLEFDRYGDPEAYRLGKRIERAIEGYRPAELAELRFNTGLDHTGDPAIWIWAFLSDDASRSDERFLETAQRLRDLLDDAARTEVPDRWPYLSFRSLAEQDEPVEV